MLATATHAPTPEAEMPYHAMPPAPGQQPTPAYLTDEEELCLMRADAALTVRTIYGAEGRAMRPGGRAMQTNGNQLLGVWRPFPLQQQAFDFIDQQEPGEGRAALRVYSQESGARGQRQFIVSSPDQIYKRYSAMQPPAARRHFYEIIRAGQPCHLYFDLEYDLESNPLVDGDAQVELLVAEVVLCMKEWLGVTVDPGRHVIELDSTTPTKFSRHVVMQLRRAWAHNGHVHAFIERLLLRLVERRQQEAGRGTDARGGAPCPGSSPDETRSNLRHQEAVGGTNSSANTPPTDAPPHAINANDRGTASSANTAPRDTPPHGEASTVPQLHPSSYNHQGAGVPVLLGVPEAGIGPGAGVPPGVPEAGITHSSDAHHMDLHMPGSNHTQAEAGGPHMCLLPCSRPPGLTSGVCLHPPSSPPGSTTGAFPQPPSSHPGPIACACQQSNSSPTRLGPGQGHDTAPVAASGLPPHANQEEQGTLPQTGQQSTTLPETGQQGMGVAALPATPVIPGASYTNFWVRKRPSPPSGPSEADTADGTPGMVVVAGRQEVSPQGDGGGCEGAGMGGEVLLIDTGVYTRNRAFRLYLSSKFDKPHILRATRRYATALLLQQQATGNPHQASSTSHTHAAARHSHTAATHTHAAASHTHAAARHSHAAASATTAPRVPQPHTRAGSTRASSPPAPATTTSGHTLPQAQKRQKQSRPGTLDLLTMLAGGMKPGTPPGTAAVGGGTSGAGAGRDGGGQRRDDRGRAAAELKGSTGGGMGKDAGQGRDTAQVASNGAPCVTAAVQQGHGNTARLASDGGLCSKPAGQQGHSSNSARPARLLLSRGEEDSVSESVFWSSLVTHTAQCRGVKPLTMFDERLADEHTGAVRVPDIRHPMGASHPHKPASGPRSAQPALQGAGDDGASGRAGLGGRPPRMNPGLTPWTPVNTYVELWCAQTGQPGYVGGWSVLPGPRPNLLLSLKGNRWCDNVRRAHRSNGTYLSVEVVEGHVTQRCLDPDCRGYRSPSLPLPPDVWSLLVRELTAPPS